MLGPDGFFSFSAIIIGLQPSIPHLLDHPVPQNIILFEFLPARFCSSLQGLSMGGR